MIDIRGLRKTFRPRRGQSVAAVDDVSLTVEAGEWLAILGPSGSGKTTLLRCVAGLERADEGEIRVDGRTVYSSARRIWVAPERRGISMVFQNYALWPHMTAFDNVAYPLRARQLSGTDLRQRVDRALTRVGCGGLGDRHPSELSGGQQQRVAVARAIVADSRVVLFDEPLSSVDARVREELRRELVRLQSELGFAAIYITHDQSEAMAIGHRVAVLREGQVAQLDAPSELFSRPASGYVADFMGMTNRLAGTVEDAGDPLRVSTGLGTVVAGAPGPAGAGPFDKGAAVTVFARPESCLLEADPNAAADENTWPCLVRASLFLGTFREYVVEVAGGAVTVRSSAAAGLSAGDRGWLRIPPAAVHVVAAA